MPELPTILERKPSLSKRLALLKTKTQEAASNAAARTSDGFHILREQVMGMPNSSFKEVRNLLKNGEWTSIGEWDNVIEDPEGFEPGSYIRMYQVVTFDGQECDPNSPVLMPLAYPQSYDATIEGVDHELVLLPVYAQDKTLYCFAGFSQTNGQVYAIHRPVTAEDMQQFNELPGATEQTDRVRQLLDEIDGAVNSAQTEERKAELVEKVKATAKSFWAFIKQYAGDVAYTLLLTIGLLVVLNLIGAAATALGVAVA